MTRRYSEVPKKLTKCQKGVCALLIYLCHLELRFYAKKKVFHPNMRCRWGKASFKFISRSTFSHFFVSFFHQLSRTLCTKTKKLLCSSHLQEPKFQERSSVSLLSLLFFLLLFLTSLSDSPKTEIAFSSKSTSLSSWYREEKERRQNSLTEKNRSRSVFLRKLVSQF